MAVTITTTEGVMEFNINTRLHALKQNILKQFKFNPEDGKYYYLDLATQEICRYDIATNDLEKFKLQTEALTSYIINPDGSLLISSQEGVEYFRINAEGKAETMLVDKIPGVEPGGPLRPNMGNQIPVKVAPDDIKNLYFLTTGAKDLGKLGANEKPGTLNYLDPKTLRLVTIAEGLKMGNCVSGMPTTVPEGQENAGMDVNVVVFGDSASTEAEMNVAYFYPNQQDPADKLSVKKKIDFKGSGGRPDGCSLIEVFNEKTQQFELCNAVAAIDSNEVRFTNIFTGDVLAYGVLPEKVTMITMPSFFDYGERGIGMFVTSLQKAELPNVEGGHIYWDYLPKEKFRIPQVLEKQVSSYPTWDEAKVILENVNRDKGQGRAKTPTSPVPLPAAAA